MGMDVSLVGAECDRGMWFATVTDGMKSSLMEMDRISSYRRTCRITEEE